MAKKTCFECGRDAYHTCEDCNNDMCDTHAYFYITQRGETIPVCKLCNRYRKN